MNAKLDYLSGTTRLKETLDLIGRSPISEDNKQLILEYDNVRFLHGTAPLTRVRTLLCLRDLAKFLDKPIREATKADLQRFVASIESREDYSVWTKSKFRGVIKKAFRWIVNGEDGLERNDDNPDIVRWIRVHVKKKDIPRIGRDSVFTEEEADRIVASGANSRDRAMLAVILDVGCRPGELGNLSVGDVYQDEFSYVLHLHGKTGERDCELFRSEPYLARWLNDHPRRDNPNAPLWASLEGRTKGGQMCYARIRKIFLAACHAAGLNRRVKLYLGRHTMFTRRLSSGLFNESQAKVFGGLSMSSGMLANYAHLVSADANNQVKKMKGIPVQTKSEDSSKERVCDACHMTNTPDSHFCDRCGRPLHIKARLTYAHMKADGYKLLDQLAGDPEFVELLKRKMARKTVDA